VTLATEELRNLSKLSGNELKVGVFKAMQQAALDMQSTSIDDPLVLEAVPRLAELIRGRKELASFSEAFNALARASGLWNYIDREDADTVDRLVADSVTSEVLGNITLHREQIAVLNDLLAGRNVILSAPTSFGKSLLVDALLASDRYKRIAIVLPTIALLDEFRRRIRRRFNDDFNVIMHPGDKTDDQPTIFLGTQERLLNRTDLGSLDLTVVDEFYKLHPDRKDERSVTLNAAVYRLLNRSKQFFFLGPNIDGVSVAPDGRWKFEFLKTRFSTVAVDTCDLYNVADKHERLFQEIAEDGNWPALVFVSSPDKSNKLARDASFELATSDDSAEFAEWLGENVGRNWAIVRAVEYGFGVHHGRIPRAIASQMVRMFNSGELPVLFCTSTLIEGVNTAAKSVFIFDKQINRSDYDFFTFSNIKGRAGRLGQHHVGKVFLFNEPPLKTDTEVAPTLFGDEEDAPDDYLVHLDDQDHTPEIDERVDALAKSLNLDQAGLRLASSVGLETAAALRDKVTLVLNSNTKRSLVWAGYPKYQDISALVKIICSVKRANDFGMYSDRQLTYFINELRKPNSMKNFLRIYDAKYTDDGVNFDNIFKFLRSCEYGLPQLFSVIELFVKAAGYSPDYSLFLHDLSRWFRAEELKNLDEEGVPIQISERFFRKGMNRIALTRALEQAAMDANSALTSFERRWLIDALDLEFGPESS
jgi:hypothetical protein